MTFRYSKKWTESIQTLGFFISRLDQRMESILKTLNMFIQPPPTSTPNIHHNAQHGEAHVGFHALTLSSVNFHQMFSLDDHMICTKMTKGKGNLAVLECICRRHQIERWLQNCDTEGNITTHSQDAGKLIHSETGGMTKVRVIFDSYTKVSSLKVSDAAPGVYNLTQ